MPDDDEPRRKGDAARSFNQAAPKKGHTSRAFNTVARVPPAHYSRDIFKHQPQGPGFTPPGQVKRFKEREERYAKEQQACKKERDMLHLRDKFNHKARER